MKPLDRIIFGTIALALMLMALQPFLASALGHRDLANVNIAAVAGKRLSFGEAISTEGNMLARFTKKAIFIPSKFISLLRTFLSKHLTFSLVSL